MPEHEYDPRALATPLGDGSPPPSPIWSRRSASFRRNEAPVPTPRTWQQQLAKSANKMQSRAMKTYRRLSPVQRVLVSIGGVVSLVLGILFLVYSERIFHSFLPYAKKWRDIPAGWLILWVLIFTVSFPPLIGYSSLLTIAGFVYGFPNGWFIAASATILGSTASFILSRSLLKSMVHRLIANDKRFAAVALTLKHDGLKILVMIRMCPLPYSLSNGAVATIPTVHWLSYGIATAIVSPKLLLHIYIGAQIARIADSDDKMDAGTKALSYISIAIGGIAGVATGWFMYKKTKERARQLEAEERAGVRRMSIEDLENEYSDDPSALEAAEALREDEDDISLREDWNEDAYGYHDDPSDAEDALEIPDDPFKAGDADDDEPAARK